MCIHHITTLLVVHIKSTYFSFQSKYFELVHDAAMASPICPIVFMEEFEINAINTATYPPRLWLRYVDDTFIIQKAKNSHLLLQHINYIDPHIQFTAGSPNTDGSIPFLYTLVYWDQTTHFLLLTFLQKTYPHRCVPSLG